MSALDEVRYERQMQDQEWGTDHDDGLAPTVWAALLATHVGHFADAVTNTGDYEEPSFTQRREAVKVAAIAVAFIESLDRRPSPTDQEKARE